MWGALEDFPSAPKPPIINKIPTIIPSHAFPVVVSKLGIKAEIITIY